MKKTYILPCTHTVQVETQKLMAASGVTFNDSGEGEIQTIDGDATGSGLSRGSNFWDEE